MAQFLLTLDMVDIYMQLNSFKFLEEKLISKDHKCMFTVFRYFIPVES